MKILITGGAGFIASHVVDSYLSQGHEVVVIDDLSTGVKKNINPRAKFIPADIREKRLKRIIVKEKPEVINHHAAHIHVSRSVENPQFDAQVNILGSLNIFSAAVAAGSVKKIIFASTGGAMYGNQQTPFTESVVPQPLSPYGISKLSTELYLHFFQEQYGIDYLALRYANVYGPRQNPYGEAGVISIFCENLLSRSQPVINGQGKQTRDYVFVSDVVEANNLALNSDEKGVFNIGTGIETDVNRVYDLVAKHLGSKVKAVHGPPRPGEQQTSSLDYTKARKQLFWQPSVSLDKGIERTVKFFKHR